MKSQAEPRDLSEPSRAVTWRRARRALSLTAGVRGALSATVALSVVAAAITAAEPRVLGAVVDALWRRGGTSPLLTAAGMLSGLLLAREAVTAAASWFGWRTRLNLQRALLDRAVGRLHALPLSYHRAEGVGAAMTRLDRGVLGLVNGFADVAFAMFPAVIYLAISAVMMSRLDRGLTLMVFLVVPIPALLGAWAAPNQARRDQSLLDRWRRIYGRFNEVLGGIATVKSFAMEHAEKERFVQEVDGANRVVLRGVGFDARVTAAQNLLTGGLRILVVAYGGHLALRGTITVGALLAFVGYLAGFTAPLQALTGLYQTLRRSVVALHAVFSILEAEDRVADAPGAREASAFRGEVVFEGVGFGYTEGRPVLRDIDLVVRPGELVALVGPSGGGKTTLMSLLMRFHDPTHGTIRIDGSDIRTFTQRSLRRQIGVVMQDALLFDDTVEANIAYGRPEATPAEIEAAARAANAHDFIERLPDGYATFVGERGGLLSTGQRQRIAIARALLKDPPILILDEATSALDAEAEAEVQAGLERLLVGRTAFVIAHRLSPVVRADRILVLRGGRIAESGSHADLLSADGHYARLVALQTRGLPLARVA